MRNKKIYGLEAVNKYIDGLQAENEFLPMDVIEGSLLDTLIIYHDNNIIEVFEETYLNEWSSGYTRHIYRKGLPKRFVNALEYTGRSITR